VRPAENFFFSSPAEDVIHLFTFFLYSEKTLSLPQKKKENSVTVQIYAHVVQQKFYYHFNFLLWCRRVDLGRSEEVGESVCYLIESPFFFLVVSAL
jgi:hypothetical protein